MICSFILFFTGAFLIVYFIAMIFCGIPIFFQEVAMGQYLGAGGMTLVSQLCPMLKGVGVATMTVVFYLDIYYCVIISWTFFYLFSGFSALPDLPWDTCGTIFEYKTLFLGKSKSLAYKVHKILSSTKINIEIFT